MDLGLGVVSRVFLAAGLILLSRTKDLERAHEGLVDGHHGTSVIELTAVVGSREEGDELALGEELVTVLNDLMGAADEIELLFLEEMSDDISTEGERDSTVGFVPAGDLFVGIGPKQITEQSSVRHVRRADNTTDLIHVLQIGGQTSMHAENLLINDGSNGEAVEAVRKRLPELHVVATLALIVETVDTIDASAFVVTAKDEEVLGVLDFVGQQQTDRFERLLSSIDVISQKQVVGLRGELTILEQAQQIVVLAVNITFFDAEEDRRNSISQVNSHQAVRFQY